MKVSFIAVNAILIASSASFTSASLRSDTMQEISHEAKLDAFTTLMEVKKSAQNCMRKNGCNFGYDYCATSKCGPCQVTPQNSYKGGACTPLSVDVDQELDVVNSMTKAGLLDIATKVMDKKILTRQRR